LKLYNKNKKLCRMKTLKMIYNMKLLNNLVSRKQNKIIKFNKLKKPQTIINNIKKFMLKNIKRNKKIYR
jgi:hypothetical protein